MAYEKTGEIFQSIHELGLTDETFRKRSMERYSLEEFGLSSLEDLECCVFGCGAGGTEIFNLLSLGAKFVHGIDLIPDYVPTTEKELKDFDGRYNLVVGSIVTHPFDDESFDFVTCNGVIHHINEDVEALNQIGRTVKKGGYAYLEVAGTGGIMDELVKGTLRDRYTDNGEFKDIIDNLSVDSIRSCLNWIKSGMENDGTEQYKKAVSIVENISDLIDNDFVQCVLDRIQAPLYKGYTQAQFEEMLRNAGFTSWKRIGRKPNFNNIRKLASPLYGYHDHLYSRLMYGDGQLSMMCKK